MANIEKLGSSSPEVLLKNATNLDKLVNGRESESLPDRFGVLRKTWHGMEMIFSRFIDYITGRGEQAVAAIGWQELGNWAVGLAVDNRQQIVYYNGSWYKYLGELEHLIAGDSPENDGGVWSAANPTGKWSNIGDAALRSNLGSSEEGMGGSLVRLTSGGTVQQAIKWVTPEMFGAVGDGVADDSDALQAAMNACVDFVWQGNVSDTDDHGATVKYYLMLPGRYRFTRTMIIPPYLRMSGIAQSYLGDPANNFTKFIPDFSMQDGYAFESLNFDQTGTHTAKVDSYSASASDRREITRCPGLLLGNFSVVAGDNTSLKGIFNFRLTHGGVLKSICARITTKAAVGANLTCTWNGAFRDCIFRTATISLTMRNNVTTWLFDNCYFQTTQGPNPLPWFTDFPEFYGYSTRQAWTACVAGSWSSPHFKDCTLENSQNGYRLHRCQGGSEHGTYFENIEEECYALMECVMSMTPGYFYNNKGAAATTRMVFLSGSAANSASIDMTNTNYFSQTVDPYNCPGSSKLVVKHAGDMRTRM
ncbi:hypothetical protein U5T36_18320, partial [Klebsiella pneumoniae]